MPKSPYWSSTSTLAPEIATISIHIHIQRSQELNSLNHNCHVIQRKCEVSVMFRTNMHKAESIAEGTYIASPLSSWHDWYARFEQHKSTMTLLHPGLGFQNERSPSRSSKSMAGRWLILQLWSWQSVSQVHVRAICSYALNFCECSQVQQTKHINQC